MAKPIVAPGWALHYTIGTVVAGPIHQGEEVETFRGEKYVINGGTPPHHEGSTGRVYVTKPGGYSAEYYPGVIGAQWVKVDG